MSCVVVPLSMLRPHTPSGNIRATPAEEPSAYNTRRRVTQPANEADDNPITIAATPNSAIRHDDNNAGDVDMEELDMYGEGDLNLIGEENVPGRTTRHQITNLPVE